MGVKAMNDQQQQDRADYLDLLQSLATIAEVAVRHPRCTLPEAQRGAPQVACLHPTEPELMFAMLPTHVRTRWFNAAAKTASERPSGFTILGCAHALYSLLRFAYTPQDLAEAKAAYSAAQAPTVGPLTEAVARNPAPGYGLFAYPEGL
jgi:hypothetical protein